MPPRLRCELGGLSQSLLIGNPCGPLSCLRVADKDESPRLGMTHTWCRVGGFEDATHDCAVDGVWAVATDVAARVDRLIETLAESIGKLPGIGFGGSFRGRGGVAYLRHRAGPAMWPG